jgi:probable rRNA maturation factor
MTCSGVRAKRSRISVRNLQRTVPVNMVDLEKFAARALALCLRIRRPKPTDLTGLHEIFVLLVSDRRMASLHRQFFHEPGPTDVLTFQHGEIFISAETAQRQARRFGSSLGQELRLYVVHGLLHLHGFDHRKETEAGEMEKLQQRILGRLVV